MGQQTKHIYIIVIIFLGLTAYNIVPIIISRISPMSVVIDKSHGLMWQDEKRVEVAVTAGYTQTHCARLDIGAYKDWRLPSVAELKDALGLEFKYLKNNDYYLSRENAGAEFLHYVVRFPDGDTAYTPSSDSQVFIRCVRDID